MSKIKNIEREIEKLTPSELSDFRKWFQQFDAENWDRQIEEDVRAGKLDALADEAINERAGLSRSQESETPLI